MATREKIREGMKRISCRWCEQNSYCEKSCGIPEQDLQKLADLGVVIKTPIPRHPDDREYSDCGFIYEPLIKEKH